MNTKIAAQIQTIRDKLAAAKIDLKNMKIGLKELRVKCRAECKRANKVERIADNVFDRRWRALEKEQQEAKTEIYKDYNILDSAESKLYKDVYSLGSRVAELANKYHALRDQEKAKRLEKKKADQHCKQCQKIKPQSPTVCHCK